MSRLASPLTATYTTTPFALTSIRSRDNPSKRHTKSVGSVTNRSSPIPPNCTFTKINSWRCWRTISSILTKKRCFIASRITCSSLVSHSTFTTTAISQSISERREWCSTDHRCRCCWKTKRLTYRPGCSSNLTISQSRRLWLRQSRDYTASTSASLTSAESTRTFWKLVPIRTANSNVQFANARCRSMNWSSLRKW